MIGAFTVAAALASAAPAEASREIPFEASSEHFADAKACRAHLDHTAFTADAADYEVVRGPYVLTEGDMRVHMVRAEGSGHRIWEHRCLDKQLSSRTWHHAMEAAQDEFTVESAARKAEWLKKDASKQEQ